MVFQDGVNYVDPDGAWQVPTVFDDLINEKQMPVTIGVFINPGSCRRPLRTRCRDSTAASSTTPSAIATPAFCSRRSCPKSDNATAWPPMHSRAIAGASSGGIAAFTVAWERPDAFGRVLSTIGTYVGLRGGDDYAALVRKTEPKPLRVFLQDGSRI